MTLLTGSVQFGDVVRYAADRQHYLVVGWEEDTKQYAVCERPGESELVLHKHWLTVVKPARRWRDRVRPCR